MVFEDGHCPSIRASSKEEFGVDLKTESIQKLKFLLKDDPCLKNLQCNDDYLLRFLYSCDFNVEKAFQRMKLYYELLLENPEWFPVDGPLQKKEIIEKDIRIMLPKKDREGRPIYVVKVGNTDVSQMELLDVVSIDDYWFEYISNDLGAREKGVCVIVDVKNCPWNIMKWLTPHNLKVSTKKLEALPFKEFKFHVVNSSFLVNVAVKLIWPFLNDEIKEMVQFHFNNWGSLHEHINPEDLPYEYMGLADLDFKECYSNLYGKNSEIIKNFESSRVLVKGN